MDKVNLPIMLETLRASKAAEFPDIVTAEDLLRLSRTNPDRCRRWAEIESNIVTTQRCFDPPDLGEKQNVEQVGVMYDGTPIYRYRLDNDPAYRLGLMADDVAPEAVGQSGPYRTVDYKAATERAASLKPGNMHDRP